MATVTLIDCTGKGRPDAVMYPARVLAFTKATRLGLTQETWGEICKLSDAELLKELEYMAGTIPSSWEFVDVTFLVSGVSRAVAQQMTRTRTASYAMQTMRVNDMGKNPVVVPESVGRNKDIYEVAIDRSRDSYAALLSAGVSPTDARGVLPLNSATNLVCKYNLRSFVELGHSRRSIRAQGEYTEIYDQMQKEVLAQWPWAELFFKPRNEAAIEMLERVAEELGVTTGSGAAWEIAKAIDLIRKG